MVKEHDSPKPKVIEIHFKPEGYFSPSDEDGRDQILGILQAHGVDPARHVFSGLSGNEFDPAAGLPRYSYFYVMNLAGWDEAIELGKPTPADYAMDVDNPCIAVFDKNQLAEVFGAETHLNPQTDDMRIDPIKLENVKSGDDLETMEPGRVVSEEVVHKNLTDDPSASPADALVALIYLDEE